jgi:ferredoxin
MNTLKNAYSLGYYMGQAMVEIVSADCTGCDLCITHCPFEALLPLADCPPERRKRPVIVLNENCVGCLSCIGSCPTSALREVIVPVLAESSPLISQEIPSPAVEVFNRWGKNGSRWA